MLFFWPSVRHIYKISPRLSLFICECIWVNGFVVQTYFTPLKSGESMGPPLSTTSYEKWRPAVIQGILVVNNPLLRPHVWGWHWESGPRGVYVFVVCFSDLEWGPHPMYPMMSMRRGSTVSSTQSFSNHPRISETKANIPLVQKKHCFSGIVYKQLDPTGQQPLLFIHIFFTSKTSETSNRLA